MGFSQYHSLEPHSHNFWMTGVGILAKLFFFSLYPKKIQTFGSKIFLWKKINVNIRDILPFSAYIRAVVYDMEKKWNINGAARPCVRVFACERCG